MSKYIIIALSIVGLVGIFLLVSSPESEGGNTSTEPSLTIDTVNTDISNGSELVDVRTPEEFSEGYIDGAINLPLDSIKSGQTPSSDKDKTLYVYCRSGNRSAEAAALLKSAGYVDVVDLGGINEVVAIGGTQIK